MRLELVIAFASALAACSKPISQECEDLCTYEGECDGSAQHEIDSCTEACKARVENAGDECLDKLRTLNDCLVGLECGGDVDSVSEDCDDADIAYGEYC